MQVERDEKSSARKGSRAFTQGWVQLQTQHSHPPFYGVVKCPSLLAFALCPFSFLFALLTPPPRLTPLHPFSIESARRVEYVPRLRCALRYFVSLRGTRTKSVCASFNVFDAFSPSPLFPSAFFLRSPSLLVTMKKTPFLFF